LLSNAEQIDQRYLFLLCLVRQQTLLVLVPII
jgi:hypothetical protein